MSQTVIGIFESASQARQAVQHLLNNGFAENNIDFSGQQAYDQNLDRSHYENDSHKNFFRSLFDNDSDVDKYAQVARRGSVVTVHAQSNEEAQRAVSLLDQYGAVDVDEKSSLFKRNVENRSEFDTTHASNQSLPVIEEEMQVGKRVVDTGGVRLRSRIIEKPVEERLRLREEHVHIERHPVDRPASGADIDAFKEGVIEIREQAEVPVVSKQAQVVEEVSLSKEVEERTETVRDTLRNTEVEVENLSGTTDRTFDTDADRTGRFTSMDKDRDADETYLDRSHKGWKGYLRRMKDVESDYKVSDEDPDVRGWDLVSSTGEKLGEVEELIVDTQAMKVRYLDVEIDDDILDTNDDDDRHVLIPIGAVHLDYDNKNVLAPNLSNQSISALPFYHGEEISRDFEHRIISAFSPTYQPGTVSDERFYEGEHFRTNRTSNSGRF
jgi:uncharacterized protein (TIGR02271 family)